jgi:hypothetical protein
VGPIERILLVLLAMSLASRGCRITHLINNI